MNNTNLDAIIAKEIYNWKYIHVGPDINGENACEILWKTDNADQEIYNQLPRSGKIYEGFLVPSYSSNIVEAIKLAKHVGLPQSIIDHTTNPETLASEALKYWREYNG